MGIHYLRPATWAKGGRPSRINAGDYFVHGSAMEHDPVFDETEPTNNLEELRDEGIIILRGFLDDDVQQGFYEGLLAHAEDTLEVSQLTAAGCPFPAAPFPFLLYNNPTTKTGNA
eukprot:jgi/Bigna1/145663/aug1.102_g20371